MEFEDFFDAFDGADEPAAVEETPAEEVVDTEEPAQTEPETEPGEEPVEGADAPSDGEDPPAEEDPDSGTGDDAQTFTVRIGEEDHAYSLEELTGLAQKGAGYDALQEQLTASEEARTQLQTQINEQQGVMDIMTQLAEKSETTVQEIAKQLYINFRKTAGVSEDAAALELENAQLKKQAEAAKPSTKEAPAADDMQDRVRREVAEFHTLYPGVKLDDAMVTKLKPDIQKGMSLANAYQKMLNEQKAAELAEQERKAKATAQNAKNRAASPGSQQDSGGRRQKSGADDFFAQFT